ncbi:MAG TPA: hypothetical protein DCO83_18380 [Mucilaginibacter sp.]|nr:hypothetical protein [Mucilaginibacter sp.]
MIKEKPAEVIEIKLSYFNKDLLIVTSVIFCYPPPNFVYSHKLAWFHSGSFEAIISIHFASSKNIYWPIFSEKQPVFYAL